MTLNLNDLMIFLESQFIQEQHAQAVSFRRLLHNWLLRWEQSIGIATAFGRDQHFIFTSAESSIIWPQAGMCGKKLGAGGTMGGDRWRCCDHL